MSTDGNGQGPPIGSGAKLGELLWAVCYWLDRGGVPTPKYKTVENRGGVN